MGLLEDELRRTLADRVASPPAVEHLADRAIAGAARLRRGRALAASLATAALVALAGGAAVAIVGDPPREHTAIPGPSASVAPVPPVAGLPTDVLVLDAAGRGWILTRDGDSVPLGEAAAQAWRVDDGWLVVSADGRRLWLVTGSGSRTTLVEGESVMVSEGTAQRPGIQVAWAAGGVLRLGTFVDGRIDNPVTATGVRAASGVNLRPWRVVGETLVLAGTTIGGGLDVWDYWTPARGEFVPSGTGSANPAGLLAVLGVSGNRALGISANGPGDTSGCLGEFDPDGLVPLRSACTHTFSVGVDVGIVPSPDGRWWAVIRTGGVALYDADSVWTGASPVRTWATAAVAVGWRDGSTLFALDKAGTVVTLSAAAASPLATLPLPPHVWPVLPIPDLRS
jgi:hypothetical protein